MSYWKGISWLGHLGLAVALQAQEPAVNLQFSGFGTLGLAATGTHKMGFLRDGTQANGAVDHPSGSVDSRLGLQVSSRLPGSLLATLQVVSRYQYDNTYRPQLQWACLAWFPAFDWRVQAGRIGLEGLPNGDFANVGYTYLWVRPPVEAFGALNVSFIDGLSVRRTFERPDGTTYGVELFGGFANEKQPTGNPAYSSYDLSRSQILGLALKVRHGGFRGRLSYTQMKLAQEFGGATVQAFRETLAAFSPLLGDPRPAQVADQLKLEGAVVRSIMLGGSWERDRIQAQFGVTRNLVDQLGFQNAWNGYTSFGYRIGGVVPYGVWARAVSDRKPAPDLGALTTLPGALPAAMVRAVADAAHGRETDQTTLSAGLRWDFTDRAALKVQLDRVRAHNATGLWRVLEPGWDGKATVMSVTLDFIFGGVR